MLDWNDLEDEDKSAFEAVVGASGGDAEAAWKTVTNVRSRIRVKKTVRKGGA